MTDTIDSAAILHCVRTRIGYMRSEMGEINKLMLKTRFALSNRLQGWNASVAERAVQELRAIADDLEKQIAKRKLEAAE